MLRRFILPAFLALAASAFAQNVELGSLLKDTGGTLEWNSLLQTGVLSRGSNHIVFAVNAPWIIVNAAYKLAAPGIRREQGTIIFPRETAEAIKRVFRGEEAMPRTFRVGAVVIDPGHGGKDSGASYAYAVNGRSLRVSEKDVNLGVGKMLFAMLKKRFPDKVVLMTRDQDVTLSLEERPAVANAIPLKEDEAIIYISLHANASLSRAARGFEVWYLTSTYRRDLVNPASVEEEYHDILPIINGMQEEEFTRESVLLAKMIMAELQSAIGSETDNRAIKEGEWLVVRKAKMPSILIELGFVSNREEALKLADPAYLQKLAASIYNGVSEFVTTFERSKAFTE